MKKTNIALSLIFSIAALCGCNKSNETEETHKHSFSSSWSTNENKHWHDATCGHDVKDKEGLHVDSNNDYKCDVCGYSLPVPTWNESEKLIFIEHLYGYELPFLEDGLLAYDSSNECVVLRKNDVSEESFLNYISKVEDQGFNKEEGLKENAFTLSKEVEYEGNNKTIDIDIFLQEDQLIAVCYDPYVYSWPAEIVNSYIETYAHVGGTFKIPSQDAYRYLVDTSHVKSDGVLKIDCEALTNLENTYRLALFTLGYSVSTLKNENGYFVATDSNEKVEISFAFSSKNHIFTIIISLVAQWPSTKVDFYVEQFTSGSGTTVPKVVGADSYEFIENSYNAHGYFFVLCECHNDLTAEYEAALDEQYKIYNEQKNCAGNYCAVSDNNDILIQYLYVVVESIFGGDDYKHFDVMFEKYYPHNEEHINAGLQIINEGTKTTLPQYPGYGEKISFSDSDIFMKIMIQSATYDSVAAYIATLNNEGWATFIIDSVMCQYQAISPDGDIKLTTSIEDGRVILTLRAIEDL